MYLMESAVLKALSFALAHSLWQAALLWMIYRLWVAGSQPKAEQRYYAACLLVFAQALLLPISLLLAYHQVSLTAISPAAETAIQTGSAWYQWVEQTAGYIAMLYLSASTWLVLRLLYGRNQLTQLQLSTAGKAPLDWRLFVDRHAPLLYIKKKVTVVLSKKVTSPLTIGFLRPVILMPVAALNQLSCQQVEAILLHELVHIRRHDYLINWFLQVASALLFFNPFVRQLLREACTQREHSCDDWVLQFRYQAPDYAKALLALHQQAGYSPAVAMALSNQRKFILLHRIRRMLGAEKNTSLRFSERIWTAMAVFTVLAAWLTAPRSVRENTLAESFLQQSLFASMKLNSPLQLVSNLKQTKAIEPGYFSLTVGKQRKRLRSKKLIAPQAASETNGVVNNGITEILNTKPGRPVPSMPDLVLNMAPLAQANQETPEMVSAINTAATVSAFEVPDNASAAAPVSDIGTSWQRVQENYAQVQQQQSDAAQLLQAEQNAALAERTQALMATRELKKEALKQPNSQFSYNITSRAKKAATLKQQSWLEMVAMQQVSRLKQDELLQEVVVALVELGANKNIDADFKASLATEIIHAFEQSDYATELRHSDGAQWKTLLDYLKSKAPKRVIKL
jgi:beta-lactamase regulating signal transducer with metallopeptidase domain